MHSTGFVLGIQPKCCTRSIRKASLFTGAIAALTAALTIVGCASKPAMTATPACQ